MWLVTGGAGYIGAHVVAALYEAGHDVAVIDIDASGRDRLPAGVPFVHGSVADGALMVDTLRDLGVTGVLHLAAQKSVAESVGKPIFYYRENIEGLLAVLESMQETGVRRLVFASSAAVYGSNAAGLVDEQVTPAPMNPYGETKLMCERIIADAARAHGIEAISLRYFNVAGAASAELRDQAAAGLVALATERQRDGEVVRINGGAYATPDGTCMRDYLHVQDLADAHVAAVAALESGRFSPIYNVGSGRGTSVLEIVNAVAEAADGAPRWEMGDPRPGDPADVVAVTDLARVELGWKPSRDLTRIAADEWQARQPVPVSRGRVVIISASVGAGHDGAAREWRDRLEQAGYDVDVHDFIKVLPARIGAGINGTYEAMLHHAPWLYTLIYVGCERFPGLAGFVRLMLRAFSRRVLRLVPDDAVAVLSTYPLSSQVLSRLRRSGRLSVPAATFMTDFSAHPLWVAPGIDAHFTVHESTARDARLLGAGDVRVTGPLVPERFGVTDAAGKAAARARFGLPAEGRLALLVAGSWGVGDVEQTAREVAGTGLVTPVVVCGRNEALKARIDELGVGYALGWVSEMPALMQAADVLIENAGGLSSLEAMASGLGVVTYRPIPGHGIANARMLDAAGVSRFVPALAGLEPTLRDLLDGSGAVEQREHAAELFEHEPLTEFETALGLRDELAIWRDRAGRRLRAAVRRRRAVASAAVATIAVGGGLTVANMAAAVAAAPVHPPADASFLVVHPRVQTTFNTRQLTLLHQVNASIAIDADFARQRPDEVRQLAADGFVLVNAGLGAPYRTDLLNGFHTISKTATLIRDLTGSRSSFFLAARRSDVTTAAALAYQHEHLLMPTVDLGANGAAGARDGAVILLECDLTCDTDHALTALRSASDEGTLRLRALPESFE